jgi:hypothetical protein
MPDLVLQLDGIGVPRGAVYLTPRPHTGRTSGWYRSPLGYRIAAFAMTGGEDRTTHPAYSSGFEDVPSLRPGGDMPEITDFSRFQRGPLANTCARWRTWPVVGSLSSRCKSVWVPARRPSAVGTASTSRPCRSRKTQRAQSGHRRPLQAFLQAPNVSVRSRLNN